MKIILKIVVASLISALPSVAYAADGKAGSGSMKDQMANMQHSAKMPTVTTSSPAPLGGTYFSVPVPSEVLNAKLYGIDGKTITLAQSKGKYIVLAPFLTSCQEICPMTSANMLSIANSVAKAKMSPMVSVLEVSVDPERDTQSRINAYQKYFDSHSWTIASGSKMDLAKFWKFFGVSASKSMYSASDLKNLPVDWQTGKKNSFDIAHTDAVIILSPNQSWSWLDLGNPDIGKGKLPDVYKKFLDDAGISNLNKPEQPSWSTQAVLAALSHLMGMKIN